jgi:osmotically-inducible protein OsmY
MTANATLRRLAACLAALALGLGLAGCNRPASDRTVGQQVDDAVNQTETAADNAKAEASKAANDISSTTRTVAADASDRVTDAAITASINADLAKDSELSALKIDVDTVGGHVTLHGDAPSPDAKDHATKLASTVRGVTSVDNELNVQP